jgi:hypothetical protein
MAITVNALHPNQTIHITGLSIYTGIIECLFKTDHTGISRDALTFTPSRVDYRDQLKASCVVSLASFACDGTVNDPLWAVDSTSVKLGDKSRTDGTAELQVSAVLAVRGLNAFILRVNYSVFVKTMAEGVSFVTKLSS